MLTYWEKSPMMGQALVVQAEASGYVSSQPALINKIRLSSYVCAVPVP